MEIDFDKLLNDYLEKYNEKNPNSDDNPYIEMNLVTAKIAAKVCVDILSNRFDTHRLPN